LVSELDVPKVTVGALEAILADLPRVARILGVPYEGARLTSWSGRRVSFMVGGPSEGATQMAVIYSEAGELTDAYVMVLAGADGWHIVARYHADRPKEAPAGLFREPVEAMVRRTQWEHLLTGVGDG
jgi:hypothetical protein